MRAIPFRHACVAVVCAAVLLGCASLPKASGYLEPSKLRQLVSSKEASYLLLDVRTPAEYGGGHIPTAVNIPYDEIATRMPKVREDEMIIVYCASGRRAAIAARTLTEMGYQNVGDFGAISRWQGELVTGR